MFLDWWTPIENLPALLKGALGSLELTLTVFALSLFFGTIVGFIYGITNTTKLVTASQPYMWN